MRLHKLKLVNIPVLPLSAKKSVTLNKLFKNILILFLFSLAPTPYAEDVVKVSSWVPGDVLELPFSGVVSPDNAHLYVTSIGEGEPGSIAVYQLDTEEGSEGSILTLTDYKSSSNTQGVSSVNGLGGAWDVVITNDGKNVYVSASVDNAIVHFSRETINNSPNFGQLSFVKTYFNTESGFAKLLGPRGMAISPDGKHLAVANYGSGTLMQFNIGDNGVLSVSDLIEENSQEGDEKIIDGLTSVMDVAYSPDGRNIYVASGEKNLVQPRDNAVAVFIRDARQEVKDETNEDSDSDAPLIPNEAFGKLTFVHQINFSEIAALHKANRVIVDDKDNVYVAGYAQGAILHFKRNLIETVFVEQAQEGVDEENSETVIVEVPNPEYGALTLASTAYYLPEDNTTTFVSLSGLLLDKDQAFVYASSLARNSIKTFRREFFSGRLIPLEEILHDKDSSDALNSVQDIVSGPKNNSFITIDSNKAIGNYKTQTSGDLRLDFVSISQGAKVITDLREITFIDEETGEEKRELPILPNSSFTAQFNIHNNSSQVLENVMFATDLPKEIQISSADIDGELCHTDEQHVVCEVLSLSGEASSTVTLIANVIEAGEIEIGVEALGKHSEIDYDNNLFSQVFMVNTPPETERDIIEDYAQQVNVIENDSDIDNHVIRLLEVDETTPKGGAVQFNKGGKFILYNPPDDEAFDGEDKFSYTIVDELGATAKGEVIITKDASQFPDDGRSGNKPIDSDLDDDDNSFFGATSTIYLLFIIILFRNFYRK